MKVSRFCKFSFDSAFISGELNLSSDIISLRVEPPSSSISKSSDVIFVTPLSNNTFTNFSDAPVASHIYSVDGSVSLSNLY